MKMLGVAQSGSASGLEPEGRRFKSYLPDHSWHVAQLVERRTVNPVVAGSTPAMPAR